MRVAIVHDWLVVYGGAERVLEHIIDCYPEADIYSLIDFVPPAQRGFLRGKTPKTSFIQKIPGAKRLYRKLLPLLPIAIEQFDLSDYDLIISSSYCVAKGVLSGPNQVHVSYCHSPMRYAWDHYHEYLRESSLQSGPLSWFVRWQLHRIRNWDVRSSNTVDQFVANSQFVRARIGKFYRRDAAVVYPPVETRLFALECEKDDYYVAAGRFVPFKRLDIAVEAFARMPDKRLIVVGDGPEMAKLRERAGPNVEFVGFQPPDVVKQYLSRARAFIFPSEEDFGIVPVEAQACGTPVIAFGSGGALETVIPHELPLLRKASPTGVYFDEQTAESVMQAVRYFEHHRADFDPVVISAHAQRFAPEEFRRRFTAQVESALQGRLYHPRPRPPRRPVVAVAPHGEPIRRPAPQVPTAAAAALPSAISTATVARALRSDVGAKRAFALAGARWRRRTPNWLAAVGRLGKRALDVVAAGAGILVLSPLLLLVALAIRIESPGGALFRQNRVGAFGRHFPMYKFRSMYQDAERRKAELMSQNEMQGGVTFKMKNDPRITRIGRWIRKTSIDELPQLFNVLRGEMSLVGPRPPLPAEVAQYSLHDLGRLSAVPGITCIWQVSGRSGIPFHQQVEMDLDYIHQQSFGQDISLLAKTVPALLKNRGAY